MLLLLPPLLRSPLFPLFPSQTLNACTYRACHGSSEMWTTCSLKGAGAKLSHLHSPPPAHSTSTIHSAGLISLSRLLLQVLLAHGVRRGERLQQCGASLHRCMRRVVKKFKKKREKIRHAWIIWVQYSSRHVWSENPRYQNKGQTSFCSRVHHCWKLLVCLS